MPLYINTNTLSLNAQTNLSRNTTLLQSSMERLSSGFRINRAGDDAAGLQLSENLRSQIRGSQQALSNTQDGINMLNVVDGAYQTIENNLQRMRELSVQAANDTYSFAQRDAIAQEVFALYDDIDRIANSTQFNGVNLLDGSIITFMLQVGPNSTPGVDSLDISAVLQDSRMGSGFGVGLGSVDVHTHANAQGAVASIDGAIAKVNQRRAGLGAFVNQLQSAASNLSVSVENLSAAEARIRDVDVAAESARLTQYQILQQSAALVLAQANTAPSLALQLLKGQG